MPQTLPPAARSADPIAGYHLRERIGSGGYGEVWSAEAPGELVKAIKFIYGFHDDDRAARELKALNRIKGVRHPFLLSLERIEVVEGQLVIVTELADGSLKDRFDACQKEHLLGIPRAELLAHLHDAADALDYMNEQHSLQHLDVKPENLLLVGGRIKVADFGLVKDMQETSASLMGGLTPIYAPPEVFDARPSRRSDQYSLAIVFQEMLTGVLPFPGKTAAQLAAQHLHARPRLMALSPADQTIVGKALSKDPAHRFTNCRELIDALIQAGRPNASTPAASTTPASTQQTEVAATSLLTREARSPASGAAPTQSPDSQSQEAFSRLDHAEEAARLANTGDYEAAEAVARRAADFQYPAPVRDALVPLTDLPPANFSLQSWRQHPTLILGLGGLAGRAMQRLRRRVADRGAANDQSAISYLLIDTDSRDLMRATHGADGMPLRPEETLALPLRKASDYRNDSRRFLDSLSRRWLFNIPRSQQTEGLRPLGRLALVDHSEELFARLRQELQSLLARTSTTADTFAIPRVVLLASISGGTGGGMVTDLAFAVRQILQEINGHAEVLLVLAHATARGVTAQELAAVSAYATLTELNHTLRPGGYFPGDGACGLAAREAGNIPPEAYLVHLGEELTAEQFQAGCDRLADFLFLETATPVGGYFSAARAADAALGRSNSLRLRSIGLCNAGLSQDQLVDRFTEDVCRSVVSRWAGEPRQQETRKFRRTLAEMTSAATAQDPAEVRQLELETMTAGRAALMGFSQERLLDLVHQFATQEMGGSPDQHFQKILKENGGTPGSAPPWEQWLSGANRVLGLRKTDSHQAAPLSPLRTALQARLPEISAPLSGALQKWLQELPEDSSVRVAGARMCVDWLKRHAKGLVEKLRETRNHVSQEIDDLEHRLVQHAQGKSKSGRESAPTPEMLFMHHCKLRIHQIAVEVSLQLVNTLASQITVAADGLVDLARDVNLLSEQFAQPNSDTGITEGNDALADLRQMAEQRLDRAREILADSLDEQLSRDYFAAGGFREKMQAGGQDREELVARLRQAARCGVLMALSQFDLTTALLKLDEAAGGAASLLDHLVGQGRSWLERAGGNRRLLCLVPKDSQASDVPENWAERIGRDLFTQLPQVMRGDSSDLVFCYELGGLPLTHAAAALIENRADYALAAQRLYTRSDVDWQPLAQ